MTQTERRKLVNELRAIHAAAKGRALNAEERTRWTTINQQLEGETMDDDGRQKRLTRSVDTGGKVPGEFNVPADLRTDWTERDKVEFREGESVFEHMARHELWPNPGDRDYTDLYVGDYLRAKLLGPKTDLERRALSEGSNTAGGHTVPTPLAAQLIDLLRNEAVVLRAGARTIPMDSQTLKVAKWTADPGFAWLAEGSTGATTDPTVGVMSMTARTLRGIVVASEELIQDSIHLPEALTRSIVSGMALQLDSAALYGVGSTGNEPTGLKNSTGANLIAAGTTGNGGGRLTWDHLTTAWTNLRNANARRPYGAVMNPRSREQISTIRENSTAGTGQYLMGPSVMDDFRFFDSNQVPNDEAVGATTNASRVFVGDWSDLFVGTRLQVTIRQLNDRYAHKYQTGFLAALRADIGIGHDASFQQIYRIST